MNGDFDHEFRKMHDAFDRRAAMSRRVFAGMAAFAVFAVLGIIAAITWHL